MKRRIITVYFSIDYPNKIKLHDIIPSVDDVLVVNSRVKNVLDNLNIDTVEYLPIRLWDHQKEPVSDDYFILNPPGSADNVPKEAKIFRATTILEQIFIHDDLRLALENADIQGYKLIEAEGWDGEYWDTDGWS